jgi:hypothetical protein
MGYYFYLLHCYLYIEVQKKRILNFVATFIFCVYIEKQEIFDLHIEYALNFAATTNVAALFLV